MSENHAEMNLKFDDFNKPGLYLIFKDGIKLALTDENIENTIIEFWNDPSKISAEIKEAADFQRCAFCPMKNNDDMCDALRPTIPFLDIVDRYVSFDEVTAIFVSDNGMLQISNTTMQQALKYVSILSLMYFCQKGRAYWKYLYGINPLMNAKEIASKLYLNLYFLNNGDKDKIKDIFTKFSQDITCSCKNQVARMTLVCKKDAFMNSFINTQAATMFLGADIGKELEDSINEFGDSYKK